MRVGSWQAGGHRVRDGTLLEGLGAAAAEAAAAGADLLVTPEMSLTGYEAGTADPALAGPADGPLVAAVSALAGQHGIAIVAGWPESTGEGGQAHNSAVLAEPTGRTTVYRKTHLFGAGERAAFAPGTGALARADVNGLRVGLLVCYDVEFPEAVRAHAVAGTQLLVVPTALPRPDALVATTVVPARAFENGIFLAYVNWCGREQDLEYAGLTRIVGPDAALLGGAGEGECLVLADLDVGALARARTATPYLADRRPALYPEPPTTDVPGDAR